MASSDKEWTVIINRIIQEKFRDSVLNSGGFWSGFAFAHKTLTYRSHCENFDQRIKVEPHQKSCNERRTLLPSGNW